MERAVASTAGFAKQSTPGWGRTHDGEITGSHRFAWGRLHPQPPRQEEKIPTASREVKDACSE